MSDNSLDVGGKGRNPIEVLPETLPYGRILTARDALVEVGEKLGLGDISVGNLIPGLVNFKGHVEFKPIQNKSTGKKVGFRVVGFMNGAMVFSVPLVYGNGKYTKVDALPPSYE